MGKTIEQGPSVISDAHWREWHDACSEAVGPLIDEAKVRPDPKPYAGAECIPINPKRMPIDLTALGI